jgi:heterodisulfide reductase subunit C
MMKLRKRFGGSEDFIGTDDPTREEVGAGMALARNLDDRGLQHTASYHCGRCLSYCPAGGWSEAFRETGLSRGFKADRMYTE